MKSYEKAINKAGKFFDKYVEEVLGSNDDQGEIDTDYIYKCWKVFNSLIDLLAATYSKPRILVLVDFKNWFDEAAKKNETEEKPKCCGLTFDHIIIDEMPF